MRVVIISPGIPHPTRGASVVLYYYYIAALVNAGHDIFHVMMTSLPAETVSKEITRFLDALGNPKNLKPEVCSILPVFRIRRFGVELHDQKLRVIRTRIVGFAADAIICFDLDAAAVAAPLHAPLKTVWLGDLNFRSMWYNYVYGFRESPVTLRWLPYVYFQMRDWRHHYKTLLATVDPIIVSSKSSERHLARLGLLAKYLPYPWPIADVNRNVDQTLDRRPTFLFFGNLTGLGSRSGFHFLFRKLIPLLRKVWPNGEFQILIAGHADLRDWVRKELARTTETKFLGFVDDLAALIARCHAIIVPLSVPVGNRSRIITAMALGGVVIAHENVALANPSLQHQKNILLFQKVEEMVDHMKAVAARPGDFKHLTAAARETYRDEFAPETAASLFVDILENSQLPRGRT